MQTLKASTLRTIPAMRAIANDVVFDVLMYLTPTFCETVLESVTTQIEGLYNGFQKVHPDFLPNGGKCSLIGHSLGSVICWDMLSILKDFTRPKPSPRGVDRAPMVRGVSFSSDNGGGDVGYQAYASSQNGVVDPSKSGTWGPCLTKPMTHALPFVPEFTMFLGSPIGMFLALRGAHGVFDKMIQDQVVRQTSVIDLTNQDSNDSNDDKDKKVVVDPMVSPFTLPSGAIYNIFHPSDPVAYRIEPLLLPQEMADATLPPPEYLIPRTGQKPRLHVQAKQLGDGIRRSIELNKTNLSSFFSTVTEKVESVIKAADESAAEDAKKRELSSRSFRGLKPKFKYKFPLGGKSERVDYQLQTGVIDNEYISAVTAHSTYLYNPDFLEFLTEKALEHQAEVVSVVGVRVESKKDLKKSAS